MSEPLKSTDFFEDIAKSLSKARFGSYRLAGSTDHDALCKYVWNLLLCESLYPGFQILEVSFRNSIHNQLSIHTKDSNWLSSEIAFLYDDEKEAIQKSKASISERQKVLTEDVLVAEMGFGFWTSLLDSRYETMWPKIIKGVFPHMPNTFRTRKDASRLMNTVRRLRNAALHHHSIWHWNDLKEQHQKMQTLIGYICNSSLLLCSKIDRFPAIYAAGYKECGKLLEEISN